MKKLFLNILLILVAVFTLVGCNEEGKLPSSQTPTVEVPKTEIPVGTPTVEVPTPTPTVSDVKELYNCDMFDMIEGYAKNHKK